jgi:tripartite-type tricarboxylate transporter receptor subunit TctC
VRGDVAIYFLSVPSAQELSAAGKLRVLAVNSAKRLPQLPDAPTLVEAGVPGYKYDSWFGVMAPAGTPKAILTKVSQDIGKVLQLPDVHEKLVAQGSVPAPTTPEQFDTIIKEDTERYAKILKDAGIEPQ